MLSLRKRVADNVEDNKGVEMRHENDEKTRKKGGRGDVGISTTVALAVPLFPSSWRLPS